MVANLELLPEQLLRLLDASGDGLGCLDAQGRIMFANQRLRTWLEIGPGSELPVRPDALGKPALAARLAEMHAGARGGAPTRGRMRLDGRPLRLTLAAADAEGVCLLTVEDRTRAERQEAELKHAQARMADFAEIARDWFWEMDADLRFTYFSGGFEQALGLPPESVIGRRREEFAGAAAAGPAWEQHDSDLRLRRPFRDFRYSVNLPDGAHHVVEISGNPVFDESGRFAGYRGTGRDVTLSLAFKAEAEALRIRLADAVESITEGLAVWDADDRLLMCNDAFRTALGALGPQILPGMTYEQMLRLRVASGLVPQETDDGDAWIRQRLSRHRRFDKGQRCLSPQGRWIETNEYRTSEGGTLTLRADVTDRVLAEKALRDSEARFERAVRGSRAGIWDLELNRGSLYLSPGFKQLLGYSEGELDDFSFETWLHPDDREETLAAMERSKRSAALFDNEFRLPHRDGDYRWFQGRGLAFRDESGQIRYFAGAIADITERAKAEAGLKSSENLFRAMFTSAGVGITLTDPEGNVLRYNREVRRMLKLDRDPPLGLNLKTLTHPDDRERTLRFLDEIARGERNHCRLIKRYRRGDGGYVWVDASSSALRDDDGRVIYVVNVLNDVTERREAEEKIRFYQGHLEELVAERTNELKVINREVASFSYSVSHDLRGPLRAIDGYSQLLLEDFGDVLDANGRSYLTRMRSASQRMGHLIDDLLMLSRLSRRQIKKQVLDLGEIAADVIEHLRESDSKRDVRFSLDTDLQAHGDPGLVRVVLNNLLGNAWKYTRREPVCEIHLGRVEIGNERAFFVRDNGVGFDAEFSDKLFKAFQRLHSEQEFEGTGVGLATVAQIISRHGGRVWAESTLGQGATFYFTLPEAGSGSRTRPAVA